jgi:hypothetical protein
MLGTLSDAQIFSRLLGGTVLEVEGPDWRMHRSSSVNTGEGKPH